MNDFSQLPLSRIPPYQASHCQEEVRRCLELLMNLNESTRMETWSDELRENYRSVVDSLAAIDIYLHLFKLSADGEAGESSMPQ